VADDIRTVTGVTAVTQTNDSKCADLSGHQINNFHAISTALAGEKSTVKQSIIQNSTENKLQQGPNSVRS